MPEQESYKKFVKPKPKKRIPRPYSDLAGKGIKLCSFEMNKSIYEEIEAIVNSDKMRYPSVAHFFRSAIMRKLYKERVHNKD